MDVHLLQLNLREMIQQPAQFSSNSIACFAKLMSESQRPFNVQEEFEIKLIYSF